MTRKKYDKDEEREDDEFSSEEEIMDELPDEVRFELLFEKLLGDLYPQFQELGYSFCPEVMYHFGYADLYQFLYPE